MNLGLDNTLLQSSEHYSSIQLDPDIFSFRNVQNVRASCSTPQKFPPAPHPSPVLSAEFPATTQISGQFTFELLKACNSTFCDSTEPLEVTTEDMDYGPALSPSTSFSSSRLPLTRPNPGESACSTFCDILKPPKDSAEDMATVSPSGSHKILRHLQYDSSEWDTGNYSLKCVFPEIKCSFPARLGSSMSDISMNTSNSDFESILAHRASDISDLSMTESESLTSYEDVPTFSKLEGRDRPDGVEFPIDGYKISSPRKPVSSVRQFLNWRRVKLGRKFVSSVGNISTPQTKRERNDSKFLMTV